MGHIPRRIAAKPDASMWSRSSDLFTFEEAVALMWPSGGPISVSTLRTAHKNGLLEVVVIARKRLVTLAALDAMTEKARRKVTE
jgi:hypothetical protein